MLIKSILQKFSTFSHHTKSVFQGTVFTLAAKLVSSLATFVATYFIIKYIGESNFGIYTLATTVTAITISLGAFGITTAIVRLFAESIANSNHIAVKGIYVTSRSLLLITLSSASILLALLSSIIAEYFFKKPDLTFPLIILSFTIIPSGFYSFYVECLRSMQKVKQTLFLQNLAPVVFSLPIVVLGAYFFGLEGALVASIFSAFLMLPIARYVWRKNYYISSDTKEKYGFTNLLAIAFPLLLASTLGLLMFWIDIIILGVYVDNSTLAYYSIAARVASLLLTLQITINMWAAPKISELNAKQQYTSIGRIVRETAMIGSSVGLIALVLIFYLGDMILGLFGDGFKIAYVEMLILMFGYWVGLVFGSVNVLLTSTGKEKLARNTILFGVLTNVALNLILVPEFGMLGAAIGTASGFFVMKVSAVYYIKRNLPINSFLFFRTKQ